MIKKSWKPLQLVRKILSQHVLGLDGKRSFKNKLQIVACLFGVSLKILPTTGRNISRFTNPSAFECLCWSFHSENHIHTQTIGAIFKLIALLTIFSNVQVMMVFLFILLHHYKTTIHLTILRLNKFHWWNRTNSWEEIENFSENFVNFWLKQGSLTINGFDLIPLKNCLFIFQFKFSQFKKGSNY